MEGLAGKKKEKKIRTYYKSQERPHGLRKGSLISKEKVRAGG